MNTHSNQSLPNKGEDKRIKALNKGLGGCLPITEELKEKLLNRIKNGFSIKDKCADASQLFEALYNKPISRRMAATNIGYADQTYMVTQFIFDWIKAKKAEVVGTIKCERSLRYVQAVTTNPNLFNRIDDNQLKLPF